MTFEWQKNEFNLKDDTNAMIATIGFTMINSNQTYVVERTFVDENHRGLGLAGKITQKFVEQVKTQNKTILPLCPFTQKYFEKHPELADLLFKR